MNFVSRNKLIFLILLITLIKGIIWSYATPLFQAPDEQVHYATVQYYAEPDGYEPNSYDFPLEKTDMFNLHTQNLSPELMNFLDKTQFEKVRFNKENTMDFHRSSIDGNYEGEIRKNTSSRFVERYPAWVIHYWAPYYQAVAGIENLAGNWSIIERVTLERFFSVILLVVFVLFAYLMLLELGLSEVSSALLAGVVSFQPMLTFITSSINIDAFLLAAFGLLLFGAVRFLGRGADIIGVSCLLAGTVISLFSKPPGYFSLGLIIFLLVLFFISRAKGYLKMEFWQKTVLGASFFIFIVAFSWLFYHLYQAIKVRYFPGSQSLSLLPAYLRHQFDYNVFYAHSTFYWGNFGWLDTPFSQPMIWVIWAILALGITGIIYFFGKNIYRWKKLSKKEKVFNYQVLFLALIVLGFNFMIHAVNFQQVNPNNVADESGAIAIQGRYFFPVIGVKFFLIFWGLTALLSQIYKKIKLETGAFILFLGGVILNFIGLFVYLVPRFYLNDGTTYFSQELLDRMSQYKPIMLKEWVIVFVLIVFLALIAKFLYLAYCRIRSNSK